MLVKKIFFILFQEEINGVLNSQVFDTITFLSSKGNSCKVIFFVNPRYYFKIRDFLKKKNIEFVLVPSIKSNVRLAQILIKSIFRPNSSDILIGRGVYAANIILVFKNCKTVYDGRGAYYKELEEYNSITDLDRAIKFEKQAVELSKYRIAVSNKLIEYWTENHWSFNPSRVFTIPTLINTKRLTTDIRVVEDEKIRICFIGSNGKWQGENLLINFIKCHLEKRKDLIFNLFMKESSELSVLKNTFPNNINISFVPYQEVKNNIEENDYALLLRENSITNEVSAPTKFAEYLAAGLKVIISEKIGDFSEMVSKNNLGFTYRSGFLKNLKKVTKNEKLEQIEFCHENFTRESKVNTEKYLQLLKQK
jgi:hypothetical protein